MSGCESLATRVTTSGVIERCEGKNLIVALGDGNIETFIITKETDESESELLLRGNSIELTYYEFRNQLKAEKIKTNKTYSDAIGYWVLTGDTVTAKNSIMVLYSGELLMRGPTDVKYRKWRLGGKPGKVIFTAVTNVAGTPQKIDHEATVVTDDTHSYLIFKDGRKYVKGTMNVQYDDD